MASRRPYLPNQRITNQITGSVRRSSQSNYRISPPPRDWLIRAQPRTTLSCVTSVRCEPKFQIRKDHLSFTWIILIMETFSYGESNSMGESPRQILNLMRAKGRVQWCQELTRNPRFPLQSPSGHWRTLPAFELCQCSC